MSIAFLLTTLVVVASPGTGAVYSVVDALSRAMKADPHRGVRVHTRGDLAPCDKTAIEKNSMTWLRRSFATSYVLLAGSLALESR